MTTDATPDPAISFNAAVDALERGDDAAARGHLEDTLALAPDDGEAILMLAQLERAAGEAEAAETRLRARVEAAPGDVDSTVELADLRLDAGDAAGAAGLLRQVLVLEPNHWEALLLLGDAFMDGQAFTEAARSYHGCVAANPFCGEGWYNLGRAHAARGDVERAIAAYAGYLDSVPDAPDRAEVEAELQRLRA